MRSPKRRSWWRLAGRVGLGLLALFCVTLLLLVWLTQSASGRGVLVSLLVPRVNAALPGELELRELRRLDASGIELRGLRVRDPGGQEVLRLEVVDVGIAARELLSGRIVVPSIRIGSGSVDLRQLGDARRGLVAAFVDPAAPKSPPSSEPPPYVAVTRIEVRELALRLPPAGPLGELDARKLALDASFELDGTPRAALERFEAKLERAGAPLASIDVLRAKLERGTTPSRVELELTLLERTKLALRASGVAPPEPGFESRAVALSLSLSKLDAGAVATLLRDPALETAFAGELAAALEVSGTPAKLAAELSVTTAGGSARLTAHADDFERLRAKLECRELQVARVRPDLPDRRVTLALGASADLKDPKRIPVTVDLRDSRLDGTALPELELAANVTPDSARDVELSLVDGKSKLRASGDVGFADTARVKLAAELEPGAIDKWSRFAGAKTKANGVVHADLTVAVDAQRQLDVSGALTVRELEAGELRVGRADVTLRLRGEPQRPTGAVKVELARASLSSRHVPRLSLDASGGPSSYRAALDGDFGDATAKLELTLERGADRVRLAANGQGLARGQPWKLALEPTTVTANGDVTTEGLELEVSGQGLRANGSFSERGSTLELATGRIQLERLAPLFGLDETPRGHAELTARLTGTPAVPSVELTLRGEGLTLGERPPLALELVAALDARAGEASAKLAARSLSDPERSLDLKLELSHRFQAGPGFQRALPDGTLDARLTVEELDTELVRAWAKLAPLPASGTLAGTLRASGTRADPNLELELRADAKVLGAALKPELRFAYGQGSSRVELAASDAEGPWLAFGALLAFAGEAPALDELLERLPRAASEEAWSLALTLAERRVERLPGLGEVRVPALLAASAALAHERGAEPNGKLRVALRPKAELDAGANPNCKAERARVELEGELASGRVRAELTASDREKRLLEAAVEAELGVAAALAGGAPELGQLHATLETQELDLATLPLVCGIAKGRVTARVNLDDPLGQTPQLGAELDARRFSLGTEETLDVTLRASANHALAEANVALTTAQGRSTLTARLPLARDGQLVRLDERAPLALDVELQSLPIAPFLPPDGPISYASGSIGGSVHARGTLAAPDVRGKLTLNDVAFTATDLAQPLHQVRGTASFTQNSLKIEELVAHDRDGVLRLRGGARLEDGKRLDAALSVSARDFPLRQQGQVVATTEIDAEVRAKIGPERSRVTIDLGAVDMWLESLDLRTGIALEEHPDFVIDGKAPEAESAEPPREPARAAEKPSPHGEPKAARAPARAKSVPDERVTLLELNAEERVWIKRSDFAVKIGAKLETTLAGGDARVTGKVSLLRGYLTLMGKDFEIQKGSALTFTGSTKPDPALDITAVHLNRRSGERVSVVITGRAQKPILTFKVDDAEVSAGEAFQAIYGSQQSNQDPKGADDQAKAFVGGLTAGLLATTARRELGAAAPIIMIEPGSQAGSGRVRAGFEFDSLVPDFLRNVITGVYFEGIVSKESAEGSQQSDARTEAGVLLEFYFPKNFFTAGQYGPGPTWSMDVGWQL